MNKTNGMWTFKVAALAALSLTAQVGVAVSCGFDSGIGNTFTPMHPKSLDVAFAVHDAVAVAMIDAAADPVSAGQAGYWCAVGHLTALQRALSAANTYGATMPAVSVLFIDSGLWARLTPGPQGLTMDVHTAGAETGDVVIVTNEPVLTAILEKRLPVSVAFERELIVVDGESAAVEKVSRQMVAALDERALSAASAIRPQAVRLFGPVRH
jgi:hypothetical protein